jgi:hypothetical protein
VPGLRTLSAGTLTGLYFIQKYRFLSIAQFARIAGFSAYHAAEVLRGWRAGGLSAISAMLVFRDKVKGLRFTSSGAGFDILCSENRLFADITEPFSDVQATWTPHMYHGLRLIDVLISAELAIRSRPHLQMVKVVVEYR